MRASIETITPEMALNYLKRNNSNRPISKSKVDLYAYVMSHGAWQLNGETIVFDVDGNLKNGQHRLLAIIKCGKPIKFVVVRDISKKANIYDRGRSRSATDSMVIGGMSKELANGTYAAVAKLHYEIQQHKKNISDYQIINFLENHKNTLIILRPLWSKSHKSSPGRLSTKNAPLLLAAMYAIESGEDIKDISDFFTVYKTGFVDNKNQSSAIVCRNDYIAKNISTHTSPERIKAECVYEKAICDFCIKYPRLKTYKTYTEPTYSNNNIFKE